MDLFLTFLNGFLILALGVLGLVVSVYPKATTQNRFVAAFIIIGVVGIGVTVWQQRRNDSEKAAMQEELQRRIEQSGSEIATQVTAVKELVQKLYPIADVAKPNLQPTSVEVPKPAKEGGSENDPLKDPTRLFMALVRLQQEGYSYLNMFLNPYDGSYMSDALAWRSEIKGMFIVSGTKERWEPVFNNVQNIPTPALPASFDQKNLDAYTSVWQGVYRLNEILTTMRREILKQSY